MSCHSRFLAGLGPKSRVNEPQTGPKLLGLRPQQFWTGHYPAVFKDTFLFFHWLPSPREIRGEGPDYNFPKEIYDLGPISARIRGGVIDFQF
jgi:hypothetical protein